MEASREIPFTARWSYKGVEYAIAITVAEVQGYFEPVSVKVETLNPLRGRVTSALLARVPVARLVSEELKARMEAALVLRRPLEQVPLQMPWTQDEEGRWVPDMTVHDDSRRRAFWQQKSEEMEEVIEATGQGTGRRYPPDHLERVAEVYKLAQRMRQHPTKAVARTFGLTAEVAARHVQRARAHKPPLLPPVKGKGSTSPRKEGKQ